MVPQFDSGVDPLEMPASLHHAKERPQRARTMTVKGGKFSVLELWVNLVSPLIFFSFLKSILI